jgi:hypothetical protein
MLKHGVATKRTILAMILTGFSRSIVNVQCLDSSGTAHVSSGSRPGKNASGFFCVARPWAWMIYRDG